MLNYTLDVASLNKAIEFMYLPREKDLGNQTLMRQNYIDVSIVIFLLSPFLYIFSVCDTNLY